MDPATKQQLTELINRPALGNKVCADCNAQNPQWCSLSFAIFICLSCAGIHRGFGVHISFVRSVSMDSFSDEQLRRMKLGGNVPFQEFLVAYEPPEIGGYSPGMSISDKYHSWAASQYREKLSATLEGRTWEPSAPQPKADSGFSAPDRPDSSQSLRKSRATGRANTLGSSYDTGSPDLYDQKAANESFFESLGAANASRSADLPPSQGGRYSGFGSTPSPTPSSSHPSFGLSSAAAPTLADLQSDPVAALGKGWSLLSSAVAVASRTVNSTVIQPSVERVSDPNFRAGVIQYVSESSKSANAWGKSQLGVDVGSLVGGLTSGGADAGRGGYTSLGGRNTSQHHGYDDEDGTSALYADGGDDDFFHEVNQHQSSSNTAPSSTKQFIGTPAAAATPKKKADDWDDSEWKDF